MRMAIAGGIIRIKILRICIFFTWHKEKNFCFNARNFCFLKIFTFPRPILPKLLQKYADIITDTVFKKLFGDERFPDLMIFLLRELIPERNISSIKYAPQEHQNEFPEGHGIRVDVECYDETTGARFAVEMQALKVRNFHDRLLAYSTYIVQEQFGIGLMSRGSGKWDYSFPQSYVIALMDYDDNAQSDAIRHEYALLDVGGGSPFTDRLKFITLELPKYHDPADPEATALDKLEKGVKEGHEKGLREGMAKGMKEGMAKGLEEGREKGMKEGREKGMKEGRAEGREKGRKEALANSLKAINLLKSGMKPEQVSDKTSLSLDYVLEIQKELNG